MSQITQPDFLTASGIDPNLGVDARKRFRETTLERIQLMLSGLSAASNGVLLDREVFPEELLISRYWNIHVHVHCYTGTVDLTLFFFDERFLEAHKREYLKLREHFRSKLDRGFSECTFQESWSFSINRPSYRLTVVSPFKVQGEIPPYVSLTPAQLSKSPVSP